MGILTILCSLLGMIIGLLIKYIGGERRVAIAQPNCTITSAAKKLYIKTVNGTQYSYTLSGQSNSTDQESELEEMVRELPHLS